MMQMYMFLLYQKPTLFYTRAIFSLYNINKPSDLVKDGQFYCVTATNDYFNHENVKNILDIVKIIYHTFQGQIQNYP